MFGPPAPIVNVFARIRSQKSDAGAIFPASG
jgi:hypothetical protein